jgi:hypothetical protein
MRLDGRTTPAVDVTAAARARADSLEDLDSDADEPGLFYPDLYPGQDMLDRWVDSPNQGAAAHGSRARRKSTNRRGIAQPDAPGPALPMRIV